MLILFQGTSFNNNVLFNSVLQVSKSFSIFLFELLAKIVFHLGKGGSGLVYEVDVHVDDQLDRSYDCYSLGVLIGHAPRTPLSSSPGLDIQRTSEGHFEQKINAEFFCWDFGTMLTCLNTAIVKFKH